MREAMDSLRFSAIAPAWNLTLADAVMEGSDSSGMCRSGEIWAMEEGKLVIPVLASVDAKVPFYLKSRIRPRLGAQTGTRLLHVMRRLKLYRPKPGVSPFAFWENGFVCAWEAQTGHACYM